MYKNLDIVFLGGLFPKEKQDEIIKYSCGSIQNAANVLQWKIVEGLNQNCERPVRIINSLYIGSYPKRYKKLWIKSYEFEPNGLNVGFFNMSLVKHFSRTRTVIKEIKKWAEDGKENKVIIAYALTSTFMKVMCEVKRINSNIKTYVVVPDLPKYMNTSNRKNILYSVLKHYDMKNINKRIPIMNGYILLTDQMHDALGVQNYVVMEGIAGAPSINPLIETSEKIVLYTGTINEKYGIMNLVKAFQQINNQNYRLIICGEGDSKQKIIEASGRDERIKYLGQLPHSEVLEWQRRATVLVNPRQNNEEFTKYSFPSKNMEYLSSGVPLIAYKLDGIPREYDSYIFYVEDNEISTLAKKIEDVCEMDGIKRAEFSMEARSFVQQNKNSKMQTKKILQLIIKDCFV